MTPEKLEAALADVRVHHLPVPEAFRWAGNHFRGGRSQAQLAEDWPTMPLAARIGLVACLFGGAVFAPEAHKVVSDAYLRLCHGQPLTELPCGA